MSSIDISASGLTAQRKRMDLIAENLANAETTRTPEGGPYQRLQAVLESDQDGSVSVKEVVEDKRNTELFYLPSHPEADVKGFVRLSGHKEYQPGHPDADKDGYVLLPNVNTTEEMVDLVSATRAYEANITALSASKAMIRKALEIGRS